MSHEETADRLGRARKMPARVRSGDVALVTLIGAVILLLLRFTITEIFDFLYHPVSGIVALLLIIEFLWLKSGDRTRIYRLEVERLRDLRRRDEDLLKQCRSILADSPAKPAELLAQLDERL